MTHYLRAYAERSDDETGPLRFTASTEGVKADGHDLRADSWSLDRFARNPVVLWSHDFFGNRPPIGRATARVEGAALIADITFDDRDDFARSIESKYRRGFLNAVSVSWDVVSERNELLEISAVPVPMDPDALMERNLRGLHTITDMLTNLIDEPDEPKGDEAEAVWQGTALQMVRLFTASADDGDFDQRAYKRLCRQYQRLGKEAPEIPDSLDALDLPTIRGLFLAGEPELVPELFVVSVDTERQAAEALSRIQTMLTGVKV